jgi:hypothetical protein
MYFGFGIFILLFVWMHILQRELVRQKIELRIKSATQIYYRKRLIELKNKLYVKEAEEGKKVKVA